MSKFGRRVLLAVVLAAVAIAARNILFKASADYMVGTVNDSFAPLKAQAQRDAYVARSHAARHAPAPVGRQLADNERCIGGTVVLVEEVDGVPSFKQRTDGSRPLACPE
ncbi:MAG: hypothetical protein EPN56_10280 [Rhodanobacter sp.]|nr:MAG: hypothetical protein EPN78_06255 [Rhodanobacter sp.]TAM12704.1 MAG: hypothetical protein EPN66_06685 [Rhodanobacter sp.]TAM35393.1 MAG: hypothetical protein EPN56_10280 [Rhodanobacter sp.]